MRCPPLSRRACTSTTFDPTEQQRLSAPPPAARWPRRFNLRTRVTGLRLRGNGQPVTVAFLGHQRGEKGYHLVPEIVATFSNVPLRE